MQRPARALQIALHLLPPYMYNKMVAPPELIQEHGLHLKRGVGSTVCPFSRYLQYLCGSYTQAQFPTFIKCMPENQPVQLKPIFDLISTFFLICKL
jgi:hypothetical protein